MHKTELIAFWLRSNYIIYQNKIVLFVNEWMNEWMIVILINYSKLQRRYTTYMHNYWSTCAGTEYLVTRRRDFHSYYFDKFTQFFVVIPKQNIIFFPYGEYNIKNYSNTNMSYMDGYVVLSSRNCKINNINLPILYVTKEGNYLWRHVNNFQYRHWHIHSF